MSFPLLFFTLSFTSFLPLLYCTNQRGGNLACDMLVAVDSTLYRKYDQNEEAVKNLSSRLVNGLNEIYHRTIFTEENEGLYFRLLNVDILHDFCNHCNQTQMEFLNEFSKMNYKEYCIAILFTYRDFPEGLAGLAWRGTMCSETFNTGFITFLNNNAEASDEESIITLAHEVGHLFGATHDEGTECTEEEDYYIMSSVGTSHHTPRFSECSLSDMRATIERKKSEGCFRATSETPAVGFCGNGILEGLEQCDCGMDYRHCDDACCYAGHVAPVDRSWNSSARPCQFNTKSTCLEPLFNLLIFSVILPFSFILVLCGSSGIFLMRDWKNKKSAFRHLHAGDLKIRRPPSTRQGDVVGDQSKFKFPFFKSSSSPVKEKTVSRIELKPIIKENGNHVISRLEMEPKIPNQRFFETVRKAEPLVEPNKQRFSAPVKKDMEILAEAKDREESSSFISANPVKERDPVPGYNPIPRRSAPTPFQANRNNAWASPSRQQTQRTLSTPTRRSPLSNSSQRSSAATTASSPTRSPAAIASSPTKSSLANASSPTRSSVATASSPTRLSAARSPSSAGRASVPTKLPSSAASISSSPSSVPRVSSVSSQPSTNSSRLLNKTVNSMVASKWTPAFLRSSSSNQADSESAEAATEEAARPRLSKSDISSPLHVKTSYKLPENSKTITDDKTALERLDFEVDTDKYKSSPAALSKSYSSAKQPPLPSGSDKSLRQSAPSSKSAVGSSRSKFVWPPTKASGDDSNVNSSRTQSVPTSSSSRTYAGSSEDPFKSIIEAESSSEHLYSNIERPATKYNPIPRRSAPPPPK